MTRPDLRLPHTLPEPAFVQRNTQFADSVRARPDEAAETRAAGITSVTSPQQKKNPANFPTRGQPSLTPPSIISAAWRPAKVFLVFFRINQRKGKNTKKKRHFPLNHRTACREALGMDGVCPHRVRKTRGGSDVRTCCAALIPNK